jgi:hypothetical protein
MTNETKGEHVEGATTQLVKLSTNMASAPSPDDINP